MSLLLLQETIPQVVDLMYESVEDLLSDNFAATDQIAPEVAPHDLLPVEASSSNPPSLDAATFDFCWPDNLWIALLYAGYRLHVPSSSRLEENRTRRALFPRSVRRCS